MNAIYADLLTLLAIAADHPEEFPEEINENNVAYLTEVVRKASAAGAPSLLQ